MADLDLLLLGATGVTGRPTAAHLSRHARGPWAIGGRDPGRLRELADALPGPARPEVVHVDLAAPASVGAAVARARVVLSAAGPFARLAPAVIAACVEHGAHYADLSGEIGFIAEMVRTHHDAARAAGVTVVQAAGFESLPFDLATRLAGEAALQRHGHPVVAVRQLLRIDPGGTPGGGDVVSGGTIASLREGLRSDSAPDWVDPAALLPATADADRVRLVQPAAALPWDAGGTLAAPLSPSPFINPPVVLRTAALLGADGGLAPDLSYREGLALDLVAGGRPAQLAAAGVMSALHAGLGLALRAPAPVRRALAAGLGPLARPGRGPDVERTEGWRWHVDVRGRTAARDEVRIAVEGRGHPGYGTCAAVLAEVGMLLADPQAELPGGGGHLTPALALGTAPSVLDRLARGGLSFTVLA